MDQTGCPNCSQPVPTGARFCPACGTSVALRVDVAERWEHYLSLSEFLIEQGRVREADVWIAKLRKITALYGDASPLAAHVERRLATSVRQS